MNEENNQVENNLQNIQTKDNSKNQYSYHFNSNDKSNVQENEVDNVSNQNIYNGGYQQNNGKTLTKTLGGKSSSIIKNPYGIRGPWNYGIVSSFVIISILVIFAIVFGGIFLFR